MLADELSSSDDDGFDPQELAAVGELMQQEQSKEDEAQGKPRKEFVNNKVGLLAKRDEISLPEKMPWIEKLDFITPQEVEIENAHDDLKREAEFYTQCLRGVQTAILQLEQARIPYMRPPDYFAEMIKPDSQMQRVKDSLLKEKKRMAISALRQKQKEDRKYASAVASERQQERAKGKRETMATLANNKKRGREGEGLPKERSLVGPVAAALEQGRKEIVEKRQKNRNKKRERADKKYGFGKTNKYKTANDAKSTNDDSSYKPGKFKQLQNSMGGKKKSGKGPNRPGKAARAAQR